MFGSYFKIAWRSIKRHKAYSLINILGLTLGIASCLVIFLVVKHETSYDQFHKKANRTYRVTLNAIDFNPCVSMAIVPALRNDFHELENVSQVWYRQAGVVKVGENRYSEKAFAFADSEFTRIFDYTWLAGDAQSALVHPNSIVLTESHARKYFGDKGPMGQVIVLNNRYNVEVMGVIKDPPGNTHLPFDFLVSFETIKKDLGGALTEFYWISDGSFAYITTPDKLPIQNLQKKIPSFIEKNWGKQIAQEARLPLQPLRDIHFDQRYLNNTISPTTSRETYWALGAVAVFIIIIACINFINLATAQAIKRAREIGVRKVLGSNRTQLVWQFLSETSFMVITALILAMFMTRIFLPLVARWLDIKIGFAQVAQPTVILMLGALTLFIILLAGLYPAFVQSAFRPVLSLKTKMNIPSKGVSLRKGLVIIQFAVSQILIVGTLVVAYQMDFFQNRSLGFNKEAVINFNIPELEKSEVLKQQLHSIPGIKDISFSSGAPGFRNSFTSFTSPELGVTKDDVTELKFIDENYARMFELQMLYGNGIGKNAKNENDTTYEIVANETMINKLGLQDPKEAIGKHVTLNGNWYATIVGVVRDFQTESKHKKRRPCALIYRADAFGSASVKIQPNSIRGTIEKIGTTWSVLFPQGLFEFEFIDERIASFYRQEQKTYTAFKMFSSIAILIGCLGLYGLVLFATAQRTKEVGIRKVLGASVISIITLFAKEFALLIAVAFVIAAPVGYYAMHNWLENFAYKISMNGGIFIMALLASFAIAVFTMAYQAIKAAIANPVKSLRTE